MSTFRKITHWLTFLFFIVVAYTAIMNTTFFSKEAIIESFNFSFPVIDLYSLGSADKLWIARIERRIGWVWHFWAGVLLFCTVAISMIYNIKNKNFNKHLTLLWSLGTVMFVSGLPLFIRTYKEIPMDIQNFARAIHHYSAYLIGFLIVLHIAAVIYNENKKDDNKISSMLKFKNATLLFILLSLAYGPLKINANEKVDHYKIGMAFYKGEQGATISVKQLPNCPYDFCKNAELMKEKMGIEDNNGSKTVEIKTIDLKKALFFFQKSAYEDNNGEALDLSIKILLSEVNYKDTYIDETLIKSMNQTLGYETIDEYKSALQKLLYKAASSSQCYATFKVAEFYEQGYLNLLEKSKDKAKEYYKKANSICPDERFEKIISLSKTK